MKRTYSQLLLELEEMEKRMNDTFSELKGMVKTEAVKESAPIEDLRLPIKTTIALQRRGITTIGDLRSAGKGGILALPDFGPKRVGIIASALKERFNLSL